MNQRISRNELLTQQGESRSFGSQLIRLYTLTPQQYAHDAYTAGNELSNWENT